MKSDDTRKGSRREFLRNLGRTTILGTIGALCYALFPRIGRPDPDQHTCMNRGICSKCTTLDDCILPRALSARNQRSEVRSQKSEVRGQGEND